MLAPKPSPSLRDWAAAEMEGLKAQGRVRQLLDTTPDEGVTVMRGGRKLINFSGNDYLGLSRHPDVVGIACDALEHYGAGAGASRLVTGNSPYYAALEQALADYHGTEAARVFGSGYLANLGTVAALAGPQDVIFLDKLAHACALDGARLSGAAVVRFRHNDMAHLEQLLHKHRPQARRALIVTESVFSMDGDIAPFAELARLKQAHDAWLVTDGAHALGVCPDVEEAAKQAADVHVGTLSKAAGSYGGYVCAAREVVEFLTSSARSLLFSTGLPPATVAAGLRAIELIREGKVHAARPLEYAGMFTQWLGLPPAQSPIVPLVVGGSRMASFAARALEDEGVLLAAIRPPTVPEGTARLRVTFSALHSKEQVEKLAFLIHSQPWFRV